MSRVKTFDSTGIATAGRLYAGDLNAIEDQYADLTNLAQNVSVGSLAVGEAGLQMIRYGPGEFRLTGAVRTDGVVRALGGFYAGAFTTAQRDAILAGQAPQQRPYGLVILNTDTNRLEWNSGTDAAPSWKSVGYVSDTTQIADGVITSAKIADGTIAGIDIADNTITSAKIVDGAIVNVDIAAAAAIAQTKIASALGLTSLSADINYLKGNSGAIALTNSLRANGGFILPNQQWLYAENHLGASQPVLMMWSDDQIYVGQSLAAINLRGTAGGVKANGMNVLRHPVGVSDRHFEDNSAGLAAIVANGWQDVSFTFIDAFSGVGWLGTSVDLSASADSKFIATQRAVSTTGFTAVVRNTDTVTRTPLQVRYSAEGGD